MRSWGPRSSIVAILVGVAFSGAAFAACVDSSNPSGSPDAGPPERDASADATIGEDGSGAADAGHDAAIDSTDASVAPEDGSNDATEDSGDASDAANAATVDAAPQLDDAGCPVLTAVVADAVDAGLPSTGISLWLRADLGVATLDGGVVCRWDDVSGHARGFVLGAGAPTLDPIGIGGKAGVSFPGPGQYLQRNDVLGLAGTSARTVALYTRSADTTHRFQPFLQGAPGSAGTYFGVEANTFQTAGSLLGVYVTNNAYDSNVATSTSPHSHVLSISSFAPGGSLPGVLVYSVDGTDTTLTRTPGGLGDGTVEDFSSANTTWVGLGQTGFTGGEIGEVLVYDHALTAPERAAVNQYFQSRFP